MANDNLLVDVADALSVGDPIDWMALSSRASPEQAAALEHLRTVDGVTQKARRDAAVGAGFNLGRAQPSRLTGVALSALLAFSAVQVLGALAALVIRGDALWQGQLSAFQTAAIVAFGVSAALLLVGGRHDHRARLLGVLFALTAASFAAPFLPSWLSAGYPEAFLPALLWAFAREFPHAQRLSWIDVLARRMTRVSVGVGVVLFLTNTAALRPSLPLLSRIDTTGVYWIAIGVLMLAAAIVLVQ